MLIPVGRLTEWGIHFLTKELTGLGCLQPHLHHHFQHNYHRYCHYFESFQPLNGMTQTPKIHHGDIGDLLSFPIRHPGY